jgi:hypothetical protein
VIKRNPAASPENAKRKDAPMSVNKVISLSKRAEDEEKPFFEQLLQEGARKLLQAVIENSWSKNRISADADLPNHRAKFYAK